MKPDQVIYYQVSKWQTQKCIADPNQLQRARRYLYYVPGCDSSVMFQPIEEAFGFVALLIEFFVSALLLLAVAFGWEAMAAPLA